MPSAAEQLASSVNFGALAKATELKNRIIFTLLALDSLQVRYIYTYSRSKSGSIR